MMRRMVIVAMLALAGCGASPGAAQDGAAVAVDAQALLPLEIATATGIRGFRVEVARTSEEQARGLMFRTALPADGGMLFPMSPPRPASFWMKNTVLSLDLIFIRADGTIARIAENAVPYSLDPIESGEPVAAVFEIEGGRAAALGIAEGDKASWPGGPAK